MREGITLMECRMLNSAFWALFTSNQALEGYHHHRALLSEVKGYIFFTGELGTYILFPPLALANQGSPNRSFYHILYSIFYICFDNFHFLFPFHSPTNPPSKKTDVVSVSLSIQLQSSILGHVLARRTSHRIHTPRI